MLIKPEQEFIDNLYIEILSDIKDFIIKAIDERILMTSNNQNTLNNKKTSKRLGTIEQQILINKLASGLMIDYPNLNKSDVARELCEKEEINLSLETIRKDYLYKHPNYS